MVPKREWVRRWVQLREQLSAQVDFDRYFAEGEVGGHAVSVLRAGLCPVPSGELLVGDPFGGLQNRGELPYFVTAPVGDYPLELSVAQTDDGRPVYAAARLRFNYRRAVSFEQALTGKEDLGSFDGGYYYAATEEELRRTIRQLRSRIRKIAFAERGLSRTLPDYEDTGQLSLPLEGGDTS